MTTVGRQEFGSIIELLDDVQARRRFLRFAAGLLALAAVVLGSLLVSLIVAGLWPASGNAVEPDQPPAALRWGLLWTMLAMWGAGAVMVLRALLSRPNAAQVARFVEQALPQVRNDLINSVLLSHDRDQCSPELVELAVREAALRCRAIDLHQSVPTTALRRRAVAAGVAAASLALAIALFPGVMHRGFWAVMTPWQYLGQAGHVKIQSVTPGDATAFIGERIEVEAIADNPSAEPLMGEIFIEGERAPHPMLADPLASTFAFTFDSVDKTFRYAVRIGDSRWPTDRPYYSVTVLPRVKVESLDVTYSYPAYTRLPSPPAAALADGLIEAPQGSQATLRLRLAQAVPSAMLEVRGAAPLTMSTSDGRVFEQSIPILTDGSWRIELRDRQGRLLQSLPDRSERGTPARDAQGGYWRIHGIPDQRPRCDFLTPAGNVAIAPGASLPVRLRVSDDYGIASAQLFLGKEGAERTLDDFFSKDPTAALSKKSAVLNYRLRIDPKTPEGTELTLYATATDNKPGLGQTTASYKCKITVQDAFKLAAQKSKCLQELRDRLTAILRLQEVQRVSTAIAARQDKLKALQDRGAGIEAGQRTIRAEILQLVDKFPFEPEMIVAQQTLAVLGQNECPLAVEQAHVLASMGAIGERDEGCRLLSGTQNRILSTLQTLLAIVPSMDGEKTQAASRPSTELTPQAKEKLAELRAELERFIDAQKKIVQAQENLAKKPVDAFTPDDLDLLNDLQAQQDKWEKFLNEKFADFSKVAQQDFSNPVMMKELVSVKSDVTMAKDALSQKAVEIATALEDNGIENAKSLAANIEKWLPDTPDRQKWTMEDPTGGQTQTEQPELPKELEDLVGDLLEQEEDLFDQMQDQTSKYNQSGDKGIGWDAMDGPISNMNAQGVTGNQLPNSNELSGRSGEGRQGKASGEYVEDKAVGKGGRRTPTRLTPEPFQKGQIDDKSPEAAGGATGGGKISGAGAEGLEGPIPPTLAKELQRLAGRQASLVNRAERIRQQFAPTDYAGFKFLQSISIMSKVQDDLRNYRYQNALRARQSALEPLRQSHMLLSGQIDVKADTSVPMPKYIRDDIADAMKGKMPAQYKDLLDQYYRKLGQTSEPPAPKDGQ